VDAISAVGERIPVVAGALTAYDPSCDRDGRALDAALRIAAALVDAAARGARRASLPA
jgi:hypothetical protein